MLDLAWIDAANALALAIEDAPLRALERLHAALSEPARNEVRVLVAAILAEDFIVPGSSGAWFAR
ncbi:MAG: hypothetical protein HOV87_34580 [Catenulispora sp.]|nr:hypothetical protein [Catenulispora sp.]